MNHDFEPVMAALFATLTGAAEILLTVDLQAGELVCPAHLLPEGLFPGLPVFGEGLAAGTLIAAIDRDAGTVALTEPAETDVAAADLRTGFLTTGRRVQHWQQVAEQPALFLRRTGVTDESDGFYSSTTLECEAWIYCNAGQDPDRAPDEVLTGLERLVRESLAPDADYGDPRCSLGGLSHWCRIEGRTDTSPGDQGPQAIARIPIRVTLP